MELVGNNLYRGPRPQSFADLQKAGIKHVIMLQSGIFELFHDDNPLKKEHPEDFGIRLHRVTMSDFTFPKTEDLDQVQQIIKQAELKGERVYVCCKFGKDRTGTSCAVYRVCEQGWTYAEAKKEMFAHGFHKIPYLLWLPSLKKYLRKRLAQKGIPASARGL